MGERDSHSILPPGIEGHFKHFTSGGEHEEWMPSKERKYYTNAFIVQDGKILLGYKKRGFGKHKYNGFGGKVEEGETPLQAALRELEEEAGITAPLEHAGSLLFFLEGDDRAHQVEVYRAAEYFGTISETEEMRPQWFSIAPTGNDDIQDIPYAKMWDDDQHWLPLLISGQKFVGRADFKCTGEVYTQNKWWFGDPV